MSFSQVQAKGLTKFLIAADLDPQKLRIHITEVPEGNRSHPLHTHSGVEAFYVLEGQATVEMDNEQYTVGTNEIILVDASHPHGIFNSGAGTVRYMVIISQ